MQNKPTQCATERTNDRPNERKKEAKSCVFRLDRSCSFSRFPALCIAIVMIVAGGVVAVIVISYAQKDGSHLCVDSNIFMLLLLLLLLLLLQNT